jgi:hypothetical protein
MREEGNTNEPPKSNVQLHNLSQPCLQYIYRGCPHPGFFAHAIMFSGKSDLLSAAPSNVPPQGESYFCIVPVLDSWRLQPSLCKARSVPYFGDAIEPEVLNDVRSGHCLLILDLSNEGPEALPKIFDPLHDFLDQNDIKASRAIWLAQNRAAETGYRAHYAAKRAEQVRFEYYDFFVKLMAFIFSTPERSPFNSGRLADYMARVYDPTAKDRIILCLNATPRHPRVATIAALIHEKLFDDALISFPGLDYMKDPISAEAVNAYIDKIAELHYLRPSLAAATKLRDLRVDEFTEQGNALHDKIDIRTYERTFFSLVTETEMSNGSMQRITEKTVKAFCLGHPTLVMGNPRSITFMTELGFRDFHHVLDLDYQNVTDVGRRFNAIIRQVRDQVGAIKARPSAWLSDVKESGIANIRHATEGSFLNRYIELYERPLLIELRRMLLS